jgi:CRP-like cAMP-binding protein
MQQGHGGQERPQGPRRANGSAIKFSGAANGMDRSFSRGFQGTDNSEEIAVRRTNRFLASFGEDLAIIRPHLREVLLDAGQVLAEPGEPVRKVYFLHEGAVSKLTVFHDGAEIECALVGREGAVGATSALGLHTAVTRDVCHLRAAALSIDSVRLAEAARVSEVIRQGLERYCAWKMSYAIRNGACNARHAVEQRLCRWLLTCSDVLEEPQIRLPQEVFAKMLGVQRTSVNPILQRLRAEGLIELGRARLTVLDRDGLSDRACECYEAMRTVERKILDQPPDPAPQRRWSVHTGGSRPTP